MVSFIVFWLARLLPGDYIDVLESASTGDVRIDRAMVEKNLGLDAPAIVQYARWMGFAPQPGGGFKGLFQGNFGTSWWRGDTVAKMIGKSWPITIELGVLGLIISQLIALPIGVYSALRQDKIGDYLGRSFAILAISLPSFWVGSMVIIFPSIWWGYMPPIMHIRFIEDPIGNLKMFVAPAAILGMAMCGLTMRMTRTMMLEVLRQDYVRTAWAKGLRERVIIVRHALKNALMPVMTVVGIQVPILVGGMVIIEEIFNLSGMGRLTIGALLNRDEPLTSGLVMVFSVALVFINLAIDLAYSFLDPTIRYE
ncbi:MAG: ABC transporter permease [Spirochaetales bacterium]|nr:ABC transporter permease [Spirochaetales bacterium]